jgi:hypothetical protein
MKPAILAACAALTASPALAAPASGLPAGAVVAFAPTTVCESLPGGWAEFRDAEGRVIVGMATGMPVASPPPVQPDYWTRGVSLKPEMLPKAPVSGGGQTVVTTPEVPVNAEALSGGKAAFWSETPTMRLFGYQTSPQRQGGSEALAVGYGPPGVVGRDAPDPVPVTPPFVALRYCIKR